MSKKMQYPDAVSPQPKKKKGSGLLGRIVRRFFLLLFTVIILALAALVLVMNLIFKGPSPAAQEILTMSLIEASATKWIPALFIGEERVAEITSAGSGSSLTDDVTDTSQVIIQKDSAISSTSNEWDKYPDGIRIEDYAGDTYNAHIMIVRDPSLVYMGISTENYSTSIPGKRLNAVMEEENVLAAINAGAFYDNGTTSAVVGSYPLGLVMSNGRCVWTQDKQPGLEGFAGFTTDDVLVVSTTNLTQAQAEEMNIRDGCCFGPVLIMNGEVNMEAYNMNSGFNPRTAIGQRADGAVIFVCIDGRQAGSVGGTYRDIIDIMVEYGAVNACNMDGGSSSIMYYRDTYGRYGEAGQVQMINSYSLLQSEPRRMPNYWLVKPAE